jgi:replicative DNA helicase
MNENVISAIDHLVGNLFFNLSAISLIAGRLHPDDMPDSPGKHVYAEMCRLYMDPDRRLSAGALEGALRSINFDFSYLGKLQSRIIPESTEALEEYADVIGNWSALQKFKAEMQRAALAADDDDASAEVLIPTVMRQLSDVGQRKTDTIRHISDIMDEVIADLELWQSGAGVDGMKTGFDDLDRIYRMKPGELTLISARPSMGKSALAMALAESAARNYGDGCVIVFSAEMTDKSLGHRMAAGMASVNGQRLSMGIGDNEEYKLTIQAAKALKGLPIYMDDSSQISTEQMYYRTAMLNARHKVNLVIFDFVELGADETKRNENEEQRISHIARGLKAIAKNLNVPVVALSQLNRDPEKRDDKLPSLADLRYSGMLEQIADVVMFIMRPEYYISKKQSCFLDEAAGDPKPADLHPHAKGVAYVIIAKQRNGATGRVNLQFTAKYTRFANLVRVVTERRELN